MLLSVQVMGYAQETVVSLLTYFTAIDTYVIRTAHQQISMVSIGTVALPAPRKTEAMQWEKASKK